MMLTGKTWLGTVLLLLYILLAIVAIGSSLARGDDLLNGANQGRSAEGAKTDEEYQPKTKAELRRLLTRMQYRVTQEEDTEPAFRNAYWDNKKPGTYFCIVCNKPLFSSETKFRSGTGWPSFWSPIAENAVGTKVDYKMVYPRNEVHCIRCKAHLGHVFNDGPAPTGLRFCMNSASLKFVDAEKLKEGDAEKTQAEESGGSKSEKPSLSGENNDAKPDSNR